MRELWHSPSTLLAAHSCIGQRLFGNLLIRSSRSIGHKRVLELVKTWCSLWSSRLADLVCRHALYQAQVRAAQVRVTQVGESVIFAD